MEPPSVFSVPAIRALLADDQIDLKVSLERYLREHRIDVVDTDDLSTTRALLSSHQFDVVIVGLWVREEPSLPMVHQLGVDGGPPVIVLASEDTEADRVIGLEMGAAAYLPKPCNPRELVARIRNIHRRNQMHVSRLTSATRRFGPWMCDFSQRVAQHDNGRTVRLTGGENALLAALIEYPERVLTRHHMLALTAHEEDDVFDRSIDVLVSRLRSKLEEDPHRPKMLRTVRGYGYRLVESSN